MSGSSGRSPRYALQRGRAPARLPRRLVLTRRLPRRSTALGDRLRVPASIDELVAAGPTRSSTPDAFAGATLLGLSMFATLFLGAVLAVFLTLGAVRGDAERGLLQPLVVRPLGRADVARWPLPRRGGRLRRLRARRLRRRAVDHRARPATGGPTASSRPALELAAAVVVIAALSLLGSVFLSSTANGIAVFMVFGAGLVAGLLGQIGEALNSDTLAARRDASPPGCCPFEALYQDALQRSPRTRSASPASRSSSARSAARRRAAGACGCGRSRTRRE